MANEYADTDTLKEHLGIEASDTSRDTVLALVLASASRGIDRDTGRRFWLDPAPTVRTYRPQRRTARDREGDVLLVDDIGSLSAGMVVESGSGTSWTAVTGYELLPENALADGRPATGLLLGAGGWGGSGTWVRVTTRFGWPTVPDEIVQATLIQAARLFKRKDSPEGVTGSAEWGVVRVSRIDPDVQALIKHFVLPAFG
ncbi:phage gp6-like head-tail connector protein [Streptomyces sanyensis]|uniref:phage gp6-like head-tail connector protein n=1 Tax=Streptomyces sanyensis TaxID=568869 RepID=UPI003D7746DB